MNFSDHYHVTNGNPITMRRDASTLAEAVKMARETPYSTIEPRHESGDATGEYQVYSPKHPVPDEPVFRVRSK